MYLKEYFINIKSSRHYYQTLFVTIQELLELVNVLSVIVGNVLELLSSI